MAEKCVGKFYPVICVLSVWMWSGCGSEDVAQMEQTVTSDDPPIAVAPALPTDQELSVSELHARIKAKNIGYNNGGQFHKAGGQIRMANLAESGVTDLSPLAGLPLKSLDLRGLKLSDILPLKGMPLEELYLEETNVGDLSPLKDTPLRSLYLNDSAVIDLTPLADSQITHLNLTGTQVVDIDAVKSLPLNTLWIGKTRVHDLAPLFGKHLESLDVQDTSVADLGPLVGMTTLKRLNITNSQVTDLTPLIGMNLTRLLVTPSRIKTGLQIVRQMQSLQELDVAFREPRRMAPAEFWERYDAGEFD